LFLAAAAAVGVGGGLTAWQRHLPVGKAVGLFAACAAGALAVALTTFVLLVLEMPWQTALRGVLGSWPYVGNQADTFFYRRLMGLDDPRGSILRMFRVGLWYGVLLLPLALYVPSGRKRALLVALGLGCLAVAVAGTWLNPFDALRPLPIFLGLLAIAVIRQLGRSPHPDRAHYLTRKLMLIVFAGVLLVRILLTASTFHYGFVLAAPGTLVLAVAMFDWLPAGMGAPARRPVYAGAALGAAILWVLVSLALSGASYGERKYPIGSGSDRFLGDRRCQFVASALEELRHRMNPGETLIVLPEGIMINYLARMESPVPFDCYLPAVLQMFDERRIVARFDADPPDYVILFHRNTAEYGVPVFGRDYAKDLYSWVVGHYRPLAVYGRDPLSEDGEGLILMVSSGSNRGSLN
jgi:hypothetical protein